MKVCRRVLIGNLLNRSPSLSPKAFNRMCGESRRCELLRDASESTTGIQKEDDAAHATAELVLVYQGCAVAN